MSDVYLTVDLGGTRIRAARCRADGTIEARTERMTKAALGADIVIERIEQTLRKVWPETDADTVKAISVVAPGPVDPWTGVIFIAPNLPGFVDIPLRDRLANIFHVPVYIGNDANLAGLAEWRFGAARGHHHMIFLTISTGIGGGVIVDDKLLLGSHGLGAELGHVTADMNGEHCLCGNVGCIEWMSSGTGIARQAVRRLRAGESSLMTELVQGNIDAINVEIVEQAAKAGDALALDVFQRAFQALGLNITSLLHIFNPSIIVIGGGVSNMGDRLFKPLQASITEHVMNPRYLCPIVPAQLRGDMGLLGALALALDPPPQRPG